MVRTNAARTTAHMLQSARWLQLSRLDKICSSVFLHAMICSELVRTSCNGCRWNVKLISPLPSLAVYAPIHQPRRLGSSGLPLYWTLTATGSAHRDPEFQMIVTQQRSQRSN